ncbi:MAG: hypothetical protein ACE5IR_04345 [bacterium]
MFFKFLTNQKAKHLELENKKLRGALEVIVIELERNNSKAAKTLACNALRLKNEVTSPTKVNSIEFFLVAE